MLLFACLFLGGMFIFFTYAASTKLKWLGIVAAGAAALTVRWPAGVVAGVEVEGVIGGDEVVWAGDVALLQVGVEPVVSVHAALRQSVRKRVRGDVQGGLW